MLSKIQGRKVRVGVAFCEMGKATSTKYYVGTIIDYDENFIVFDTGTMIGLKYIQTIEMV